MQSVSSFFRVAHRHVSFTGGSEVQEGSLLTGPRWLWVHLHCKSLHSQHLSPNRAALLGSLARKFCKIALINQMCSTCTTHREHLSIEDPATQIQWCSLSAGILNCVSTVPTIVSSGSVESDSERGVGHRRDSREAACRLNIFMRQWQNFYRTFLKPAADN